MPIDPDTLDRTHKLALDSGEVETPEDAEKLFASYVLQLDVRDDALSTVAGEAAFATILNAAPRAFQGGVRVRLAGNSELMSGWVAGITPTDAVARYGCEVVSSLSDAAPTLVLGSAGGSWPTDGLCLTVAHSGWAGGVLSRADQSVPRGPDFPPAGVLAGSVAVAEAFQALRGNVRAGRRGHGLSLWRPDRPWLGLDAVGPDLDGQLAPSRMHLLGLGHLGQAYVWTLGWLPYPNPGDVEFVLQDVDVLTKANIATGLLATRWNLGQRKARVAELEARGFQTRLFERRFDENQRAGPDDPAIAMVGVDNPATRSLLDDGGWQSIIDVGLGAGAGDYLHARVHAFPGEATPQSLWGGRTGAVDETLLDLPAYRALERRLGDRCGAIMIAGRAVGAAFVGAFASAIAVGQLLRYYADDEARFEVIDLSLRDLSRPRVAMTRGWAGGDNLGYVVL
jgi:hypothetical protein